MWAIRRQHLLHNKFILVNNKYLDGRYMVWYKAGIKRIHDIVDQKVEVEKMQEEYGIDIDVIH